jgi:propionyl-CoA carboxylase alpha chain
MINRLLVANRGEIARRIFRSCRDAGISTVAVFSDADASALHTGEADLAVALTGNTAAQTYLRADLLIGAAVRAGADAIHPGYGFLSENAAFARAVLDAGLCWVGPSPEAIEAMASKIEAKKLMADAGVPVLSELDPLALTEAELPVIVKASAGGGGRGMRVVRTLAELPAALEAASAEAKSAFGDPTVFCEPYVEAARHIEVQVLADQHGTVWALGERECSLQRRHQKVLEEAPSPFVDQPLREQLGAAAIAAARAVGYVGAGTVEFLVDAGGRFFFLEMNTRLQVEHPVTECVTGLDLVALQLRVADGERLEPLPPPVTGHAIEVRLYAEDPAQDWRPQSGVLHTFTVPGVDAEFAVPPKFGLRLDSGFAAGCTVGVFYDPMLAKVIAWAPTRAQAARRLASALAGAQIHGLVTNRDLLVRLLRHPEFLAGATDTAFFDRHGLAELAGPLADADAQRLSALAAALADAAANRARATVLSGLPSGWRNLHSSSQRKSYDAPSGRLDVAYRFTRAGLIVDSAPLEVGLRLVSAAADRVVLDVGGLHRSFAVASRPGAVEVDSILGAVTLRPVPRFAPAEAEVAPGSLIAPMPGTVVRVAVAVGDTVTAGQPLLWIEAMKMEHQLVAPADGVVAELSAQPGRAVELGAVLAVVEPSGPPGKTPVAATESEKGNTP